jgi:hypothetical protein
VDLIGRGILYVELSVETAAENVHSSRAVLVHNAAWRLIEVLRTDPAGRPRRLRARLAGRAARADGRGGLCGVARHSGRADGFCESGLPHPFAGRKPRSRPLHQRLEYAAAVLFRLVEA